MSYALLERPKTDLPMNFSKGGCALHLDVGSYIRPSGILWLRVGQYAKSLGKNEREILLKKGSLYYCKMFQDSLESLCPNCPAYKSKTTQTLAKPGDAGKPPSRLMRQREINRNIRLIDDDMRNLKD